MWTVSGAFVLTCVCEDTRNNRLNAGVSAQAMIGALCNKAANDCTGRRAQVAKRSSKL